jgi:hypothetical protein
MPKALNPARMKKRLKMKIMPKLRLRNNNLLQPVVEHLFLMLDPTLLRPTYRLPLLHLPKALLPPLLPKCLEKLKFDQIPRMPGAVVRYTQFAFVAT